MSIFIDAKCALNKHVLGTHVLVCSGARPSQGGMTGGRGPRRGCSLGAVEDRRMRGWRASRAAGAECSFRPLPPSLPPRCGEAAAPPCTLMAQSGERGQACGAQQCWRARRCPGPRFSSQQRAIPSAGEKPRGERTQLISKSESP